MIRWRYDCDDVMVELRLSLCCVWRFGVSILIQQCLIVVCLLGQFGLDTQKDN